MKTFLFLFVILTALSGSSFAETNVWDRPDCGFEKTDLKLEPESLMKLFLKKDSEGEFMQTNPWLNSALLCPSYLGGPDKVNVINSFKLTNGKKTSNSAEFKISYQLAGTLSSGGENGELYAFMPANGQQKEIIFKIVKTPAGWKIDNTDGLKFAWLMVLPTPALSKSPHENWVSGNREQFLKATIPYFSSFPAFVLADTLAKKWEGEWGKWESYELGSSISIKNCDAKNFCEFTFVNQNKNNQYTQCENYSRPFKIRLLSENEAEIDDAIFHSCRVKLTRKDTDNKKIIEANITDCRTHCVGGEFFPKEYPFRSIAHYPNQKSIVPEFMKACYLDSSIAMKTWCETPVFNVLDARLRDLNEQIKKMSEYKQGINVNTWRTETIKSCNDTKKPVLECLNLLYASKISELEKQEQAEKDRRNAYLQNLTEPADPEIASKMISEMEGVYKYRFKNGNMSGDKYQSEDILEIVKVHPNAVYFKVHTEFSNGHTCGLFGLAKYTKQNKFVFIDNSEKNKETVCIFSFWKENNKINFHATSSCSYYCGARGNLSLSNFDASQKRKIRYLDIILNSDDYKNSVKNTNDNIDA